MKIVEKVTVENAKSADLVEMMRAAMAGVYDSAWKTKEGQDGIVKSFDKAMNDFANQSFNAGREYEQNKLK